MSFENLDQRDQEIIKEIREGKTNEQILDNYVDVSADKIDALRNAPEVNEDEQTPTEETAEATTEATETTEATTGEGQPTEETTEDEQQEESEEGEPEDTDGKDEYEENPDGEQSEVPQA